MEWYNASWTYRLPITSQNAKVAEAVSNAYVKLDDLGAGFWSHVKNGGGDIRVTEADGETEVAREVVFCNTSTEKGEVHFDSAGIQTGSDVIWYIYYGNAAASDYAEDALYGREAVWSSDYVLVAHFTEDPAGGAPQMLDSTSNDNDGTTAGSMVVGDLVDADVGKGLQFEKSKSQYVDFQGASEIVTAGDKTYTAILKNINQVVTENLFNNYRAGSLATSGPLGGGLLTFFAFDASWKQAAWDASGLSAALFHSVHGVADTGSNIILYVNGALKTSVAIGTISNNPGHFHVAVNDGHATPADTTFSEMRIANVLRSADYILTEHNNLMDVGTFWSIGSEEEEPVLSTLNRIGGVLDRTSSAVLVRVLVS